MELQIYTVSNDAFGFLIPGGHVVVIFSHTGVFSIAEDEK